MLNKILGLSGTAALYLCTSLLLSQILLFAYLSFAWQIDKGKLYQMLAIAQGVDMFRTEEKLRKAAEDVASRVTWDQVLAERANVARENEFDRMTADKSRDAVLLEARRLEEQRTTFNQIYRNFETRLQDVEEQARNAEIRRITTMLERMDETLAKRQILEMIDRNQIERVVTILKGMQDGPRSNILNEMSQDDEVKKLADIFEKIASGVPVTDVVQEARDSLNNIRP